jgi:uncharacterized Rmd1/YagE family protein
VADAVALNKNTMRTNKHLHLAKRKKNDEYYTLYSSIEKEMSFYHSYLRGKVVYCNCDDYRLSNFYKYFKENFNNIGLKRLIATHYVGESNLFHQVKEKAYKVEYDGNKEDISELVGNGDFRSRECKEIMNDADIVITNPPFSLFRQFIELLVRMDKEYIVLGSNQAIVYTNIFNYFKIGDVQIGHNEVKCFVKDDNFIDVMAWWYVRLKGFRVKKLGVRYNIYCYEDYAHNYPKYDNYDAINCDSIHDIPLDYYGNIGVPINYCFIHNSEQYDIIDNIHPKLNGKEIFRRIIIRKKQKHYDNIFTI